MLNMKIMPEFPAQNGSDSWVSLSDKFGAERSRYAEQELRPTAISIVQGVVQRISALRLDLLRLVAEVDRLSRCKQGMRSQLPKIYKELERRAHSGNDRVTEQVERTPQEIEDLQAMNPGSSREQFRYREEFRGVLPGLRILAINVRDEVVSRLTAKAETLLATSIASLPTEKLLEWEGWALRFDETLTDAQRLLAAGDAFFSPESFRLMAYVATVHTEKAALSKLTAATLLKGAHVPAERKDESAAPGPLSKNSAISRRSWRRSSATPCTEAGRAASTQPSAEAFFVCRRRGSASPLGGAAKILSRKCLADCSSVSFVVW
jgi:hypothetical protein